MHHLHSKASPGTVTSISSLNNFCLPSVVQNVLLFYDQPLNIPLLPIKTSPSHTVFSPPSVYHFSPISPIHPLSLSDLSLLLLEEEKEENPPLHFASL